MDKQLKKIKFVLIIICLIAIGMIVVWVKFKPTNKAEDIVASSSGEKEIVIDKKTEKSLIIQNEAGEISKVDVASGEVHPASALEKEDFSGFAGFPLLGVNGKNNLEQGKVIVSKNKAQAIIAVTTYDNVAASDNSDQSPAILSSADYLCDVAKKTCQQDDLLTRTYQGFDAALQRNANSFAWDDFDEEKSLLFGHTVDENMDRISPVYVCNVEKKICNKTESYDSTKGAEMRAAVPDGSLSPSLEKFVMVNQHDQPNNETGKTWELILYASSDLSKPLKTYDISMIIDRDESVAYDAVHSIAWSADEKKIAIGTSRRIFMFDVATGGLSLAYIAPTDEEGDFYWDSSALFLSPDAKAIFFVDELDEIVDETVLANAENSTDEPTVTYVNMLKKIDLENGKVVSQITSGNGLSLKK